MFVRENDAGVAPNAEATTVYVPAVPLAFAVTVASPVAPVVAGDPVITADAPVAAGVNVTAIPGTTLPPESFTTATSGDTKDVPTAALWPLPLLTLMVAAAPTLFVSENTAGTSTPTVVAFTT